ncbi:MAG: SURF1 family protein [Alphaproteobacteria bacterium]|nr:SURF1 family protein [Alphaproteobacteria bacterium]
MRFVEKISLPATILSFLAVCFLIALGVWQIQRLAWKTDLEARLEVAYSAPENVLLAKRDIEKLDLAYGRFSGKLLSDKAFQAGIKLKDGQPGHDLIVPLRTAEGDILINLGWSDLKPEDQTLQAFEGREIWFEGLARKPSWNYFTPENQPEKNIWYRLDIPAIAQVKGLVEPWPYVVYAERSSQMSGNGLPNNTRPHLSNNHLHYALFWFSMAGILIVVYIFRFLIRANPQE